MIGTVKINWSDADRDYKKGQNLIRKGDWANGFKLHELRSLPDAFWNPNGSIGTYVFVVTVTNEYGCVFGQQTITLTVNCD